MIIRSATKEDIPALAALHVQTFNETHGFHPNGPTVFLRLHQWQKLFDEFNDQSFCLLVTMDNNALIGFAYGKSYHDSLSPAYAGLLNKIYLLKKYHRQGFGRKLICKVAEQFMQRNINSMLLFGDAASPSNGFYEAMGGEKLITEKGEFHGGYGWKNLEKLVNSASM